MQQTKGLEKVPEMESKGSIFTETEGVSFENSIPNKNHMDSDPFKNDESIKGGQKKAMLVEPPRKVYDQRY